MHTCGARLTIILPLFQSNLLLQDGGRELGKTKKKAGNNPAKLGIFPAFEAEIMSWSLFLR